jgi:carotenoid cleavage dioxygenase
MRFPVFVPRAPDAAEGDGWLLVPVNRHATMLNHLLGLDAQRLETGFVATVKLPLRLRNGIHGTWAPRHLPPMPRNSE